MDLLKKLWPFSFGTKDVANLIIKIVVYVVIAAVLGVLVGFLNSIPVVGIIFWILGPIVWIYTVVGIVLVILDFLKILK